MPGSSLKTRTRIGPCESRGTDEPFYSLHADFLSQAAGPSSGEAHPDRRLEFANGRDGNEGDHGVAGGGMQDEDDEGGDDLPEDVRRANTSTQTEMTEGQRTINTQLKILETLEKTSSPDAVAQGTGRGAGSMLVPLSPCINISIAHRLAHTGSSL